MVKSFNDALNIILDNVTPLEPELVNLADLVGRVVATDIVAPWPLPRWDNSEMDGFAVRAEDCTPLEQLSVDAYIPAGSTIEGVRVKIGTAARIMTGAPIPAGCDAIVPIENTTVSDNKVTINCAVSSGDFIRYCGRDIAAAEKIISAGTKLRPVEINLLASFSLLQVPVIKQPRVAILSTGDELVSPGEQPAAGQITDSNSWSLASAVKEVGAIPVMLGIAKDNSRSLQSKIVQGLEADVLITSAGVSAGDRDFVRESLAAAGVKQHFWKVAIKPGGPTAFGCKDETKVFSLPGNPVSSLISFDQLVRPALLKMMGYTKVLCPLHRAKLEGSLVNETAKMRFLRVRVESTADGLVVRSAGNQNTGIISTMVQANGIAIMSPEQNELVDGDVVDVQLL